jgi:hypothetical protein
MVMSSFNVAITRVKEGGGNAAELSMGERAQPD